MRQWPNNNLIAFLRYIDLKNLDIILAVCKKLKISHFYYFGNMYLITQTSSIIVSFTIYILKCF